MIPMHNTFSPNKYHEPKAKHRKKNKVNPTGKQNHPKEENKNVRSNYMVRFGCSLIKTNIFLMVGYYGQLGARVKQCTSKYEHKTPASFLV